MTSPVVSFARVATPPSRQDVIDSVQRAMELARWEDFIPRGAEIALKPNLGWDLFLPGATTRRWRTSMRWRSGCSASRCSS